MKRREKKSPRTEAPASGRQATLDQYSSCSRTKAAVEWIIMRRMQALCGGVSLAWTRGGRKAKGEQAITIIV